MVGATRKSDRPRRRQARPTGQSYHMPPRNTHGTCQRAHRGVVTSSSRVTQRTIRAVRCAAKHNVNAHASHDASSCVRRVAHSGACARHGHLRRIHRVRHGRLRRVRRRACTCATVLA
eukprot:2687122-Prymnesium_polylepis.1